MEEINNIGMKHIAHEHLLILNEDYFARGVVVCSVCGDQRIVTHTFVYSCSNITCNTSIQFQFHKHPLSLSFCLPEVYRKFHQFCRLCNERLCWIEWLYCCCSCRYFTHFQCARSSPMSRSSSESETYPKLVHLPAAADELSLNLLLEQFIKDMITLSDSSNNSSISSATNYIKHWSHKEHDLKLITIK